MSHNQIFSQPTRHSMIFETQADGLPSFFGGQVSPPLIGLLLKLCLGGWGYRGWQKARRSGDWTVHSWPAVVLAWLVPRLLAKAVWGRSCVSSVQRGFYLVSCQSHSSTSTRQGQISKIKVLWWINLYLNQPF